MSSKSWARLLGRDDCREVFCLWKLPNMSSLFSCLKVLVTPRLLSTTETAWLKGYYFHYYYYSYVKWLKYSTQKFLAWSLAFGSERWKVKSEKWKVRGLKNSFSSPGLHTSREFSTQDWCLGFMCLNGPTLLRALPLRSDSCRNGFKG